jgi:hypothetical protein
MRSLALILAPAFAICVSAAAQQSPDTPPPEAAQQDRTPPSHYPGPISGSVFHQPTRDEVRQRERASYAEKERARQQDQEVDQLYKQLMNPASSCTSGQGCQ